jgi:alkylhydroperoxidase/carboxymuconolactone decarboxylase family protein YurZ
MSDAPNLQGHGPAPDAVALEAIVGPYRGETSRDDIAESYRSLLGFVPPRIQGRIATQGALDPEGFDLTEQWRAHLMNPPSLDTKTAQLILFAVLLAQLSDAAQLHAIAARRAGASWEELNAVIGLTFLFRGLSAANRGAEILSAVALREKNATPS